MLALLECSSAYLSVARTKRHVDVPSRSRVLHGVLHVNDVSLRLRPSLVAHLGSVRHSHAELAVLLYDRDSVETSHQSPMRMTALMEPLASPPAPTEETDIEIPFAAPA